MIHEHIMLGHDIVPDSEYLEYLQCQHLYGGMTPNERQQIDGYTLDRDWYFFTKEKAVQAKKNNKDKTTDQLPEDKTFQRSD